jgi:glucose-6-phosphate 1-dehydrogenase
MDTKNTRYRPMNSCEIEEPRPCCLVIFGASGDLTRRKLMPSLFHLFAGGMLPDKFFVLGTGREEMGTDRFRSAMLAAVQDALPGPFDRKAWDEFSAKLYHTALDYRDPAAYGTKLRDLLPSLERKHQTQGSRLFYLAVPPAVYEDIIGNLGAAGLASEGPGSSRIVIEKPFGRDLESSRRLNSVVHEHFQERQVFRIDHYLAK